MPMPTLPSAHSVPTTSAPPASSASSPSAAPDVPRWVWAALGCGVALAGVAAYVLWGGDDGGGDGHKETKRRKARAATDSHKNPPPAEPSSGVGTVAMEDLPDDEDEEPSDPLEWSVARKNKGNKYFKGGRYELAVKCYSEAIERCPIGNDHDLATFHQNRAAAYDQLEQLESVVSDCSRALELNKRYVKALERRAKALRRQAAKMADGAKEGANTGEDDQLVVRKLKTALEDLTAACVLEGFQRQDHLMLVDAVLKELGRKEAQIVVKTREPILTSKQFIQQYFMSFSEDPVLKTLSKTTNGDAESMEPNDHGDVASANPELRGFVRAKEHFRLGEFGHIVDACSEEIERGGPLAAEATVLRGTFYTLSKRPTKAMHDFDAVIESSAADDKLKANALIKRASLFVQRCQDPIKDPEMAFADFARALELDGDNADVYHHRGQVYLLTDQTEKAMADFSKAVALNPDFPIAYVQKLYTDYRAATQRQDKEAINQIVEKFEQAKERFPNCVETHALFAQVLSDQAQFQRADEVYQEAQKIDPGNANLFAHRGLIALQQKGDVQAAVDLIKRGIDVDDKCEFAYETLGTIELQRGNPSEAVELFNKAIPLANTELEMAHLFGLRNAAMAQSEVTKRLDVQLPTTGLM